MTEQSVSICPTGAGVGAFVEDVDLSTSLGNSGTQDLLSGLGEHGVLFFRDQTLSPEQHLAFAEEVGDIDINRFFKPVENYPKIAEVRKEPVHKVAVGERWHTDHSYDIEPALGSILVARELPSHGGDTIFSNMYKAYDALSDGLKKTLDGLTAEHSTRHRFGAIPKSPELAKEYEGRIGNADMAVQDSVHPVVIRHPISGKKALYVNADFTTGFAGWTVEESQSLLDYLYAHAAQEEFTYRFQWKPGSIAFWDNRASWHKALNDYHGERRLMHRITIRGEALSA